MFLLRRFNPKAIHTPPTRDARRARAPRIVSATARSNVDTDRTHRLASSRTARSSSRSRAGATRRGTDGVLFAPERRTDATGAERDVATGGRGRARVRAHRDAQGVVRVHSMRRAIGDWRGRSIEERAACGAQVFFPAASFTASCRIATSRRSIRAIWSSLSSLRAPRRDGQMNAFDVQKCDASELQVRVEREGCLWAWCLERCAGR